MNKTDHGTWAWPFMWAVMFCAIATCEVKKQEIRGVSEDKTGSYHMVYVVYKYHWEPVYSAMTESECEAWFKHWIQSIDNVGAAVITKNEYGEYLGGEAGMNIVSSLFGEE